MTRKQWQVVLDVHCQKISRIFYQLIADKNFHKLHERAGKQEQYATYYFQNTIESLQKNASNENSVYVFFSDVLVHVNNFLTVATL